MNIDDCYQLGYIIKPHGLKGELQLLLDVDSPEDYQNLESVFVRQGQQLVPFFIEYINVRSEKAIVAFDEIQDFEQAKTLKGAELYLPLSALPEPSGDQFYLHEIDSFQVISQSGQSVGCIKNVIESGPQLILVVENVGGIEILLPYTESLLIKLDREAKEMHINIADGLIDVYTNPENED
ncbi:MULTISPECIES: ribosome maturation factor RimM [Roseivirga]|uniref:Ribosome maturation factor RimM n=1 Tax=Roseivirga spongicola TaxID=333140 RepID=A0A150XFI2_9BACT|nr:MULTISPECIES: ribosome maturation factor RimM [Roseivirga]KYG77444.1 hypothetical protein AWW68_01350 [Roseivirga spongicola]MBO6661763.1 16S rRNA processing protein RimM [Roseivirga sp.]MBO6760449.1 16S rRNA processing protein RimM [Roseivirga sp.]MBO6908252.1 16S rRNA processing protein RimM [Roseivirga sp.]WPZ11149.1 ribosome maturation factor RimM [Roseivirga spongicola]